MAPKIQDPTWAHLMLIMRYFANIARNTWEGTHRLKEHLTSQKDHVVSCDTKEIGPNKLEMKNMLEEFKEDKARQKGIDAVIGRKRRLAMGSKQTLVFKTLSLTPLSMLGTPFCMFLPFIKTGLKGGRRFKKIFTCLHPYQCFSMESANLR